MEKSTLERKKDSNVVYFELLEILQCSSRKQNVYRYMVRLLDILRR